MNKPDENASVKEIWEYNNQPEIIEKNIQEVLNGIDFEKIYSVMHHLNWIWYGNNEPPTIYKIMKSAEKALNNVVKNGEDYFCGGWDAKMDKWGALSLKFVVTWARAVDGEID